MDDIDSTPEMAARLYETLRQKLEIVRRRVRRPLTLADKLLLGHLDDPEAQDLRPSQSYLALRPDRVVFQDVLGQSALLQFMQTGLARVAIPHQLHCDHLIQARTEGAADLRASLAENHEVYGFLRTAAAKFGAGFWGPGAGIIHQVVLENYAFPGTLIIGTDSHTPNAGGLGACAIGVGGADAVEVISGLPWELLYPRRIAVYLSGALGGWTAPKDVILFVAGALGASGGTNAIVEYIGPGARTLSATGKATITNMGAEIGATTSIFPPTPTCSPICARPDATRSCRGSKGISSCSHRIPRWSPIPSAYYERVLELDLSSLEPHVTGPRSPDRARPISAFAAELREAGDAIPDATRRGAGR